MHFKRHTIEMSRPRHPCHPMPQQATEGEEEKRRKKMEAEKRENNLKGRNRSLIRSSELAAG